MKKRRKGKKTKFAIEGAEYDQALDAPAEGLR
jgi:hypothetical protein